MIIMIRVTLASFLVKQYGMGFPWTWAWDTAVLMLQPLALQMQQHWPGTVPTWGGQLTGEEHIQLLICVWFKDALFLQEKRPHYSFIEHTTPKYFSHNSLHFVVFSQYETYSHSQDRRYCITLSLWPDIPNLSWDCFTVLAKYLLGAVVWTHEAQTLLWGQIHHWVDHKAPTMLWFPWCAESLLHSKVSYTTANAEW